jgi:hypothetical protein
VKEKFVKTIVTKMDIVSMDNVNVNLDIEGNYAMKNIVMRLVHLMDFVTRI